VDDFAFLDCSYAGFELVKSLFDFIAEVLEGPVGGSAIFGDIPPISAMPRGAVSGEIREVLIEILCGFALRTAADMGYESYGVSCCAAVREAPKDVFFDVHREGAWPSRLTRGAFASPLRALPLYLEIQKRNDLLHRNALL
jgi:hypothetical protein